MNKKILYLLVFLLSLFGLSSIGANVFANDGLFDSSTGWQVEDPFASSEDDSPLNLDEWDEWFGFDDWWDEWFGDEWNDFGSGGMEVASPVETEKDNSLKFRQWFDSLVFDLNYLPSEQNFVVEFKLDDSVIIKWSNVLDQWENPLEVWGVMDNIQLLVKTNEWIKMYTLNEINNEWKDAWILIPKGATVMLKWELDEPSKQTLDTLLNWDVILKIEFIWEGMNKITPLKEGILENIDTLTVNYLFNYILENGNWNPVVKSIKKQETWAEDLFLWILFLLLGLSIYYINLRENES